MILWGRASSVNVQKVLWALEDCALPYEHKIVGGIFGGNDDPKFAALTPVRRVPVLQDGISRFGKATRFCAIWRGDR